MAVNPSHPKPDQSDHAASTTGDKGIVGANKGTSSGGTPGGKLPNDKSPQSDNSTNTGDKQ